METLYQNLFWYTFMCYLAGFAGYALYFSLKKEVLQKVGMVLFSVGLLFQTSAFVVKWMIVGSIRFQNMFEHIMLMSWAGVAIMLYVIWKYKNSVVGIIISPIIVMLNAAAALLDSSPAENLMPALQSNWLTIHISLAALGSGAFIVAGAVSMLYLMKNHEYTPKWDAGKKQFFTQALMYLVYVPVLIFFVLKIAGMTPSHTAFSIGAGYKFATQAAFDNARTVLGQFVIVMGMLFIPMMGVMAYVDAKKPSLDRPRGFGGVMFAILTLAFALSSLIVGTLSSTGLLLITPGRHVGGVWKFFEFMGAAYVLALVFFVVVYFLIYIFVGEKINKLGSKLDLLDEINYRAVSFGYPLYTVGALFAGAIWAEQAWGSFWSWDPKEVGALLVWLFYSAVLHARYNRDWQGEKLAILSIIGTITIFVTFYGNYFFGGLHAYA